MTQDQDHLFAPAQLLRGHTSADTAYVVDDYPYGRVLRCKIRYWLHTADSGAKKDQIRRMSQTTNPKIEKEVWNKPKASTYAAWAVLYRDARGHVEWWPVLWAPTPWRHMRFVLVGLYGQLNDTERGPYDYLLTTSARRVRRAEWDQARRAEALIRAGATQQQLTDEHRIYVDDIEYRVATECARAGLDVPEDLGESA